MVDTLDLKSRLAKLRLAGVQQDQHVKRKIQDDNEWEDIKRESYEEPQPEYPEEIEAENGHQKIRDGDNRFFNPQVPQIKHIDCVSTNFMVRELHYSRTILRAPDGHFETCSTISSFDAFST